MTATFHAPPVIIYGGNALADLAPQLRRLGTSRILLITDPFMQANGVAAAVAGAVRAYGYHLEIFDDIQPDPTDLNVAAAVAALKQMDGDAIVALGGGSAMDTAKAAAVLATNDVPLAALEGVGNVPIRGVPLIAIPTTAGTGSEATKVAVITDTQRQVKMLLLDPFVMPTVAIVDYELTLSMPASLTAFVGIDTLTHGIEAYVSRRSTPISDLFALECVRLVARHLRTAVAEPDNHDARDGMMRAAMMGGMAFTNSSVALVHAMSRPIGALFHVPHGLSNAVLLPTVTRFSIDGNAKRYAEVAHAVGAATPDQDDGVACARLIEWLIALNDDLSVPLLRHCRGVSGDAFDAVKAKMAEDALASGSANHNPVVPDAAQIIRLYEEAY
ncbi:iron-containing alcohol dehydrogenase [Sphingobium algorifonticola]|uniref:Alcohol dehydrogenase 2 n=1 Tax=Sphingobium algorifonticola TaxID=2008318 RepID=A0A437JC69_9SPHN|nr:iron-containing alcohol dehydrogenase [Sphingobium algorifonticola]RVT43464.1 iron-containing alcohol dehydrogenase [Sphingobium algorifonticola]